MVFCVVIRWHFSGNCCFVDMSCLGCSFLEFYCICGLLLTLLVGFEVLTCILSLGGICVAC